MKTIKFLIVLTFILLSFGAKAQTILPKSELSYKAWGNIAYEGHKVSEEQLQGILDPEQYTAFAEAKHKFASGKTLCIIAIPLAAAGAVSIFGADTIGKKLYGGTDGAPLVSRLSGVLFMTGAIAVAAVGIPNLFVGRHRIQNVVEDYNRQNGFSYEPSVSFGAQQYGIGFAYKF
jgi:hypothetical protein